MNTDFTAFRYEPAVRDQVGSDRVLLIRQFYEDKIIGSFFSCIYEGALRVHIVFDTDTDAYNEALMALMDETLRLASLPGKIWTGNGNRHIMSLLTSRYGAVPDAEVFHYESTEYRMPKEKFIPPARTNGLEIRPYEEQHIDAYLELLNGAMSFFIPPHDFLASKPEHREEFRRFQSSGTFEAFWKDGALIGLYWLDGNEIDTIAISPAQQRRGYGSVLLSRAIQRVFETLDADFTVLYCVGWNHTAQTFYRKYGMELYTRHHVRYSPEEG